MSKSEKCFIVLSILLLFMGYIVSNEPVVEQRDFLQLYIELPLMLLTAAGFAGVIYNKIKYNKEPRAVTLILFALVLLQMFGKVVFG